MFFYTVHQLTMHQRGNITGSRIRQQSPTPARSYAHIIIIQSQPFLYTIRLVEQLPNEQWRRNSCSSDGEGLIHLSCARDRSLTAAATDQGVPRPLSLIVSLFPWKNIAPALQLLFLRAYTFHSLWIQLVGIKEL